MDHQKQTKWDSSVLVNLTAQRLFHWLCYWQCQTHYKFIFLSKYRNWLIQRESTIGYSNTEKWEGGQNWFSACIEKCFYSRCPKMQTKNELISDLWNQYYRCMLKWILLKTTNSSEAISLYQWTLHAEDATVHVAKWSTLLPLGIWIFGKHHYEMSI